MTIPTYNPALSVMLFKNIDRQQGTAQRYQGAQRTIDLTPYLGDTTTIDILKDIYRPDGTWRITFGDQPDPTTMDTFYSLIEPMDVIEIRGSRNAYQYAGTKLPLLMRGLVGSVRRAESMQPDAPKRSVIVMGSDWGKLWLIHGVWMEVALSQEAPLLTTFQLQAAIGMSSQLMGVSQFVQTVTGDVVNRKIQAMAAFATTPGALPQFTCQATVTQGLVVPQAVGLFAPGPFWNLVKNFSDSPWNELWIDDSDATGPVLIFRPAPFKDINGNWLGGASDPGSIALDYSDVIGIEVGRSDDRCANFFWTPPGSSLMDSANMVAAADISARTPFDFNHPNNEPGLYGYRKMEWSTTLLPGSLASYPVTQAPGEQSVSGADIVSWHVERAALLQAMNQDNVVLEDGIVRCRGREDFRPGRYLKVTRNRVTSEFYMTGISHSIVPFTSWESTLVCDRGTGFLARNKMQGSPFWAEGRPGVFGTPSPVSVPSAPGASLNASGGEALA